MPTDPYVPSEIGDRPRQQQNLPPGLALPPARDWRADRPGDREASSAASDPENGALMGRPGPNVGYAYTLAARVCSRLRLSPHEHAEDVIAVLAEIAGKRAGPRSVFPTSSSSCANQYAGSPTSTSPRTQPAPTNARNIRGRAGRPGALPASRGLRSRRNTAARGAASSPTRSRWRRWRGS